VSGNFALFLWLLKLGALFNLYVLARTFELPAGSVDPRIVVPARIFFRGLGLSLRLSEPLRGQRRAARLAALASASPG